MPGREQGAKLRHRSQGIWRTRLVGLALAGWLGAAGAQAAWAAAFADIPANHWASRPAVVLASHGIMPGRTAVDFSGEAVLTRYELAWFLSKLYNDSSPPGLFQVLSDMPPQHAATAEVQRSLGFGLITTRKPGYFEGDSSAKRKEVVLALDTLFSKNGIAPPAPRNTFTYSDVPKNTLLGAALDRVANRYGLLDGRSSGEEFKPEGGFTRYQVLAMLVRSMRYLRPAVANELKTPSAPPSVNLLASPAPNESPRPSVAPTPRPSGAPAPSAPGLTSRVYLGPAGLMYMEQLPTDAGTTVTGEASSIGTFAPGGVLSAAYWDEGWGLTFDARTLYVGISVASAGKEVPIDLLESQALVGAHWVAFQGEDTAFTLGLVAGGRYLYNLSNQLVSQSYMTADKTYFGAGPSLGLGWRLAEGFSFTGRLGVVPMLQTYNIPSASPSIFRVGLHPDLGLAWALGNGLRLESQLTGLVAIGGGGVQTQGGLSAGLGLSF